MGKLALRSAGLGSGQSLAIFHGVTLAELLTFSESASLAETGA